MRLITILCFCFALSPFMVNGQGGCGTITTPEMMENLRNNKANWNRTINRGFMSRFVPVTFTRVGDNTGDGRFSEQDCLRALCILNERYLAAGADMFFYLEGFKTVNNTGLHTDAFFNLNFANSLKDRSSLNIFVVEEIRPSQSSPTDPDRMGVGPLGFYTGGFDVIVCQGQNMGDAGYTLEHEIGHFFTLSHTHYGWEDEPFNEDDYPEKIEFLEIGSSQTPGPALVELVDGSNCEVAGDEICDTPPDYGHGFSCGCCADDVWVILDRNCDTLAPMMNNIMSYSSRCNTWEFSPDQIVAMQTDFDAPRRAYLRTNEDVTSYEPIRDTAILLSPGTLGALESILVYDEVVFDWEPVEDAEFYELRLNGEIIRTEETQYKATTLSPNSFVEWSVVAFNKFGGGCVQGTPILFRTGNGSVSVSDLDFVSDVEVYPNPLTAKETLNVNFESAKALTGQLQLVDVSGRVVYDQKINISAGLNTFELRNTNLAEGIHIMTLNTKEGFITEKIVVQ